MIDNMMLDAACEAYEQAQATYVRTSRQDPALDRKYIAREEAYDRLVTLLLAAGRVHHHSGLSHWVECGELHRVKTSSHVAIQQQGGVK